MSFDARKCNDRTLPRGVRGNDWRWRRPS